MKKLLAILLTLSLLLCALPALAELGSADVAMNGNQYHISLESVEIKDGKLYVATSGMAQTMAFGPEGVQLAADIVPVYGEERLHASDKDILFGADVTYRFDRDTLPDAILMIPTQDAENPITLWENPDAEPAIQDSPDEGTTIPDELVGQWQGTGAPKNGGPSIDLTATINADGTGEYTFDQSGYHESYPFTISSDDSAFSVDIPADNTLSISACGGTWALEGGVLKLDITTTFASGGSYAYTAECERADAARSVPAWAGREWQLDTIHFKTLSEDSPYSIDGGLSLNGGSTYGNRLILADGAVDTDIDLNGLIEAVPQLPFSVPELDLTGYDGYTLDGDTLCLEPGDIEMTVGHEDDALSLTYVTHVDIQSQSMGDGLTSRAGETDLEVIMGFVPMEAAPAEDSVEETEEVPAEEPVEAPAEEPKEEPVGVPAEEPGPFEVGDTVTFGHYEQDGDDANGPEPIEWIVLDTEDAVATLISRYGLDCKPYNDSYIDVTWETCTLRQWLNSEFIDAAFSSAEQAKLMTTTVKAEKNPSYDTNPGNDTQDRVFLMSVNEAERYFASDSARQAQPTTHAVNQGGYVDGGNCYWWLRSPGSISNYAARVLAVGSFGNDDVSLDYYFVRPVIRLRLDNMPGTSEGEAEAESSILPGMTREDRSSSGYDTAQHLAERYGVEITDGMPVYVPAHPQPLNAYMVTHAECDVGINGDDMYKVRDKGLVDSITRYLEEWIEEIEGESGRTIRFVEDPDSADVLISACQTYKFYATYGQGTYRCSAYSSTVTLEAVQLSHPENRTGFSLTQNPGNTITTNGGSKNWRLPPELENTPEMAVFVDTVLSWYGWGLNPGAQGEGVAALQQALIDRGCLSGETSGLYDAQTEDAVKALQTACGLNPTGRVDAGTLIAIHYDQQAVDALPEEARAKVPEFEYGGEVVHCPDSPAEFELKLFTNNIRDLTNGFLSLPAFANGCEMVVRLAPVNGTITHDEIMAIQDSFKLRSPSGTEVAPYAVITGAEAGSETPIEAFDIVYHSEEWAPLESWGFLCDGVLYSLAGLPEEGEPLHPMPSATPTPEPTPEPTLEPTLEPTAESTEDLPDVKSLLDAGAQDAAKKLQMGSTGLNQRIGVGVNAADNAKPTVDGISDADMTDAILDALSEGVYRTTYDALLSGEVVQKGSKGDAARGVQQTLVAFGQSISVDGNVGPKSIAALNAVQASFGLPETESLDAEGYATLLPRLLMVTNPDEADALLAERMDASEYDYMRACALVAQGKYASAKSLFEECGWGDCQARAEACVQPWPKTGVLYKNPNVKGSSTELAVQFNTDEDTAMLVKIYTTDGVLARTMFIGGTGKAKTSLPAGTYIIKDGTGHDWFGEEEAFGSEGYYEIMTFGNDEQEVQLKKNYSSTITVNVQEDNPDAEGVGSDRESWYNF